MSASATGLSRLLMTCAALGLCLCAPGCPRAAGPRDAPIPAAPAPRLGLVVLVVVDQMPSWMFEHDIGLARRRGGGIARLLEQGVYFPRAELPYAATYTAPGHAALGTGAPPATTGILGNHWYDATTGQHVSSVADTDSPVFDIAASRPGAPAFRDSGASGARLAVMGVADSLREATGGRGKAISISWKERSAILATGQRPDLAIWYDADQPAMTTSRYYTGEPPAWLLELARAHPIAPRLEAVWTPLAGVDHAKLTSVPDDNPGEAGGHDFGATFPHRLADARTPAKALRATPFADELVLETALAALAGEDLGTDDVPDLLAVSFSAHDYGGHNWGQESWERLDLFVRVDDKLAALLAALDQRVGRDRYAVVLTSDHGATRLVELGKRAGKSARRIPTSEIMAVARGAASEVLGSGEWVAAASSSSLHVTPAFHARDQRERDAALDAMVSALTDIPGVAYAARVDRVTGQCDRRSGVEARVCRSLIPGMSGDIVVAPAPDHLITDYTFGTSHGSPNPDDSAVPIIVMAPGWPAGKSDRAASLLQVAPTLADLLGVPRPPAAQAPPLTP
jgi:predicted AlkP superfamily pyrophosphatase or phosphodiesterase